jgi:hypothetical protein
MKNWIATGLIVAAALNLWAEPSTRYGDNGDGTVTDTVTGLMWTKSADHGPMSWSDAVAYCSNLTYAGYHDWRLPSVARDGGKAELDTLFRADGNPSGEWEGPSGDKANSAGTPFVGVQFLFYWSGTSLASNTNGVWVVDMYEKALIHSVHKAAYGIVWPVRGGR